MSKRAPSIRMILCCLAPLIGCLSGRPVLAQDAEIPSTPSRISQSDSQSTIEAALEREHAEDWGLRAEEWARYQQLMHGPLGVYSPGLDPLTALGIEARTDEERQHFAELQVRAEGRRTEKTLAYQRAYDDAWKRLYPTLLPMAAPAESVAPNKSPPSPIAKSSTSGRLAVFVKDDCPACDQRVKQLQTQGRSFDLYMVGSRQDDTRIRQWAARAGIDPAKVKARIITLNHDGGRWLSSGGKGELPAAVVEVDGQWQRE